ncbi:ATP-binding cassette domain-containing protein [Mycoplasma leonicaptivi]|uniref:ATP-binding cassette domain-containing protein n=1 Tax=Mycoplasma leonicaptivi TaxID=36742 RepID=UPI00047F366A|nr:ATP-binding cassette domain-containing protein [Mycoplasma leonicaptivi]
METKNAIEFIDISKYFGSIKANHKISFEVRKGTVHALIGENGAGKSTLMSILFGLYEPDTGTIKVNDKEVLIKDPNDANALGIGMVHQHFKLVDVYTNLENIVLGSEDINKTTRIINYKHAIKKIKAIQNKFDIYFDLFKVTGKESVATQQKVEIMKMLYRDSEILIFDEPTAVLTEQEIQGLLNTFKLFRNQGKTILFISHKLGEIKEVADNATVLRHGQVKGNFSVKEVSIEEMAQRMVGGEVENIRNSYSDTSKNEIIFKIDNVSTEGEKPLKNVSLDIRSGEILAIAGVEGNGQGDLEYVVSGMKKPFEGNILLKRTPLVSQRLNLIKKESIKQKIGLLSLSILSILIGIILLSLHFEAKDIRVGTYILSGLCFATTLITGYTLFNKLFGVKLYEYSQYIKSHLSKNLSQSDYFKLKVFKNLSIIFTLILIVLSALSITNIQSLVTTFLTIIVGILVFISLFWFLFIVYKIVADDYAKGVSKSIHINWISAISLSTLALSYILLFVNETKIVLSLNSIIVSLVFFVVSLIATLAIWILLSAKHTKNYFVKSNNDNENQEFVKLHEMSVYNISKLGLSFIPSDRHKHGLVLDYNIKYNTVLRRLWDSIYQKFGIFKDKAIQNENDQIIEKFDVRGARNGYSQSRQLSGGNQQKFIVGREMNSPHDFILINQPTRGLDVGAIKNIHERILKEKEQGKAILLISYELDEVLALADKIAVINGGEIIAVKEAKDLTRTQIGIYMAHKKEQEEK